MRPSLLAILASAVAVVVLFVQGIHPLTLWTVAPVFVVMAFAARHMRQRRAETKDLHGVNNVMCLLVLCPTLLVHLAWHFDWAGTATGSSTSGLIFLFAPAYSLGTAVVVAIMTMVIDGSS